jgi:hypothetical protein
MTVHKAVSNNTVGFSTSCLVAYVGKFFEVMMTAWGSEVTGRILSALNSKGKRRTEFLAMRVSVFA